LKASLISSRTSRRLSTLVIAVFPISLSMYCAAWLLTAVNLQNHLWAWTISCPCPP